VHVADSKELMSRIDGADFCHSYVNRVVECQNTPIYCTEKCVQMSAAEWEKIRVEAEHIGVLRGNGAGALYIPFEHFLYSDIHRKGRLCPVVSRPTCHFTIMEEYSTKTSGCDIQNHALSLVLVCLM